MINKFKVGDRVTLGYGLSPIIHFVPEYVKAVENKEIFIITDFLACEYFINKMSWRLNEDQLVLYKSFPKNYKE